MDPYTLAALAQFAQGAGQNLGQAAGYGGQGAWGQALGSIPGFEHVGGFLSGRAAKKEKRRAKQRFQRALGATEAIQGRGFQQQEALTRQATAQQLAGYDAAKREASRLGRTSKRAALDRETQQLGRVSQGLANSGLGSTTVGANLQRGVSSDTTRNLSSIDEGLASIYGDLALGRAGTEAAGTSQLADLARQQGDWQANLTQMRLLGGHTLGSLGPYNANFFGPSGLQWQDTSGAFGGALGGLGGGGQQGGLDPQLLQQIFGGFGG